VLDAARDQAFTGIVEFRTTPVVRVCFDRGQVYLAERVTDPPLGARLVDAGALTATELEHGTIRIGDLAHLGRLFERVPSVNRHRVLVVLEMMTDEATRWLAPQPVRGVDVLPYEMHATGVHRWERDRDRTVVLVDGGAALPPPVAGTAVLTPDAVVGDVDQLADDVRIEWADAAWMGSARDTPVRSSGPTLLAPVVTAPPAPTGPSDGEAPLAADPVESLEPDDVAVAFVAAEDVVDDFEVIWPTGEVQRELPGADREPTDAVVVAPPLLPPATGLTWNLRMPAPTVDLTTATEAELVDELAEEVALAVRRAIAAIANGDVSDGIAEPLAELDVAGGATLDDGPLIVRSSTLTPAETEAAQRMSEPALDAPTLPLRGHRAAIAPRRHAPEPVPAPAAAPAVNGLAGAPAVSPVPPPPVHGAVALSSNGVVDPLIDGTLVPADPGDRAGALRRLISAIRRR
jgi:hypothetical protein